MPDGFMVKNMDRCFTSTSNRGVFHSTIDVTTIAFEMLSIHR